MLNAAVSSSNAELKADQDADYHASVAADEAKREAKKKAAEDQRACELQEAEEKQLEQVMQLSSDAARREELDRKRQRLSAAATASPLSSSSSISMRRGMSAGAASSRAAASADASGSGGSGGSGSGSKLGSSSGSSAAATMWQLRIRLPCGKQLERRFDKSETLGVVRDFVDLELAEMKPPSSIKRYTLSTAYPRRTFGPFVAVDTRPAAAQPSEVRMSLAEAGLCSRAALMLHDADA